MKSLPLFLLLTLCSFKKPAQECSSYYYFKKDAEVTFITYNGKNEKIGRDVARITDVASESGASTSLYKVTKYDKNDRFKEESAANISCDGNQLKIGFQIPGEVASKSGEAFYSYPSNMKVGQELEGNLDFSVNSTVKGKKTNISFNVKNRHVIATEKVKTPFGTFDSYKIQYDLHVRFKVMGIPIPMNLKVNEWFSPGLGVVKTESYNKDGKLEEYSVLTTISTGK